jgi:putative transcriptional regulator
MKKETFEELNESLLEVLDHSRGKITLRTRDIKVPAQPERLPPAEIVKLRKKLGVSQAVFARLLGVARDTEVSWEQGRRIPSGPALRLLEVARRHPEYLMSA